MAFAKTDSPSALINPDVSVNDVLQFAGLGSWVASNRFSLLGYSVECKYYAKPDQKGRFAIFIRMRFSVVFT